MTMYEFSLSRAIIRTKYTIVLTLGAVIGVICLIVITSLFNNYYLSSEIVFMGIHPHIRIQKEGLTTIQNQAIIHSLQKKFPAIQMIKPALYKEIKGVIAKVFKEKFFCVQEQENGPYVCYDPIRHTQVTQLKSQYGFTIVEKKAQTLLVKGITVENNETVSGLKKIINGSSHLEDLNVTMDQNKNPIPWSFYLQQDLFPDAMGLVDFLLQFPGISTKQHHFLQKGTLSLGTKKEQYPLVIMSLANAQLCLGQKDMANTLELKLKDPYTAEEVSRQIRLFLGQDFQVENWVQYSRGSFAFLHIIKIMLITIIFSISVVAAIGMISTLSLIVLQNRGKIAILKSMGIKDSSIYKIFIINTGLTGFIGVFAGTVLGIASSHFLIGYLGDTLKKLGIKNPQILIEPREIVIIALMVITLFLLTAIIPSRRAIATDVVQGLQEQ